MGADSTVPSLDNDVNDLDWIDVKPLNSVSDVNLDNTMAPASVTTVMTSQQTQVMTMATLTRLNPISNPVMSQPYLQTSTPNIQGLLSGILAFPLQAVIYRYITVTIRCRRSAPNGTTKSYPPPAA